MANEITVTTNLSAVKGNLTFTRSRTFRATWATARQDGQVQAVGTTHEAITVSGDIATLGVAYFTNLDATNFVDIGRDVAAAFVPLIRLKPGESCAVRLTPGITPYAKADTAACDLEWQILND